ncbi:MAG: hypothetical protein ACRCYZ_01555, partial [Alphaproteobacteria bacterium]
FCSSFWQNIDRLTGSALGCLRLFFNCYPQTLETLADATGANVEAGGALMLDGLARFQLKKPSPA